MNYWKVLGGVIAGAGAGVGAVVFLPVAGTVGAVTLAGSAIAAGVGAAVGGTTGAVVAEQDEEKDSALKDAKAKMIAKENKFNAKFNEQITKFKESQEYFDLVIALFAMGMAAANADGKIVNEEQEAIDEFIAGLAKSKLPKKIKDKINNLKQNPPSLNTAITLAKKIKDVNWELFETVISLVANADGKNDPQEIAFKEAFHKETA